MRGPAGTTWRKSSYSGSQGDNCVEVGPRPGAVSVRDTKRCEAGTITVSATAWTEFVHGLRREIR
jgi:hypothetical protein